MRKIDPFGYFLDHASAIPGHGGAAKSPDPRYCFHTQYEEVRPGSARFQLNLEQTRASRGELTARVHAYRPDGLGDVMLVASSRMELLERQGEDIVLDVRFRAARDVRYAFYGFFSEPSDLSVAGLSITLEEIEGEEEGALIEDVPRSALADRAAGVSASQSGALVLGRAAHLDRPVSQDCTQRQLASRTFAAAAAALPAAAGENDPLRLWSEVACRQALITYGAIQPGLRALLVGGIDPLLTADQGIAWHKVEWPVGGNPAGLTEEAYADILISFLDIAAVGDAVARYATVSALLGRLMMGGLGLLCFRYQPADGPLSSSGTRDTTELSRNEIGQWILRIIGAGFSAAPLAFAPIDELVLDNEGRTAILLILRRL